MQAHDSSSHPSHHGTLNCLMDLYWWPNMTKFVHQYVDRCLPCQQAKINTHPSRPSLSLLETAQHPFQFISMDFVTDLPPTKGFDSILMVVNQGLIKAIHLIPCSKTTDSVQLVQLLI